MWVFDKCCCCIDLRTGCFIIGYLQLVTQAILTIVSIIGLVIGIVMANDVDEKQKKTGWILLISFSVVFLLIIPFLAFTITYVVGLHKNKPGHVKIYLIWYLVFLVLSLVLSIVGVARSLFPWQVIFQQLFYILLNGYYLLVIRSYWLQMMNRNGHPRA